MSVARLPTSLDAAKADVRAAIGAAASRTGVDFSYLLAQANSESGLNPAAKAASSTATGLYQFLDQSWLAIVKRHGEEQGLGWAADAITPRAGGGFAVDPALRQAVMGLREQAGPAALMAAAYASDNAAGLSRTLGREAGATDLYFAHFLGLAGATRFLQAAQAAPGASAATLFPREARANRAIFYDRDGGARTLAEVYQVMGDKLAAAGAGDGAPAVGPAPAMDAARLQLAADFETDGAAPGGSDVADALAALASNRIDMLKPTPAQARLAYLMLSAAPLA